MALHFNIPALTEALLNSLQKELEVAFETWETEVYSRLKFQEFRDNAVVEHLFKKETNMIIAYLKANTYVLADSYGTGSLMLSDNPGFQEYRNSDRWNKARSGKTIVGRPRGSYKDAFGNKEPQKSLGTMEGVPIEGLKRWLHGIDSGDVSIEPVSPSYALQDAEKFLYSTYLPRAYKLAVQNVNFGEYLIES